MSCPHCKNDAGFVGYREKYIRELGRRDAFVTPVLPLRALP